MTTEPKPTSKERGDADSPNWFSNSLKCQLDFIPVCHCKGVFVNKIMFTDPLPGDPNNHFGQHRFNRDNNLSP